MNAIRRHEVKVHYEPPRHGAMAHQPTAACVRTCRDCGCTDTSPCPGGCYWVEWSLCSRCAGRGWPA